MEAIVELQISTQDQEQMHKVKSPIQWPCQPFILILTAFLLVGCRSDQTQCCTNPPVAASPAAAPVAKPVMAPAPASSAMPAPPVVASAPVTSADSTTAQPTVRIKAGTAKPYTDSNGSAWLPDQGFKGGELSDQAEALEIANTMDPGIYRSERYGMNSFSYKLPNGKYMVKLHFAETYEPINGPGQRVFSFNVEGQEFKDFDVWSKAGGSRRAYIETVNVDITDGSLDITFTSNVENPQINGIEIIPSS
jgi:hypothetical protein